MKDKITENNRIIDILIAALGIILLIGSISFEIYNYTLDQKAIKINALVTEVNYNNNTAAVSYKVEEQDYSKVIKIKNVTVNSTVEITYNKDNPSNLINNKYYIYIAILGFIISLVLIKLKVPTAIDAITRNSLVSNMKKNGYVISAPISEIIIDNTKKQVKGGYPYKLRAKYLNPQNNTEYTYESESVYVNLSYIIQKYNVTVVRIFIDKTNTNNYYVDLKSLIPEIPIVNPEKFMNKEKDERKAAEEAAKKAAQEQQAEEQK